MRDEILARYRRWRSQVAQGALAEELAGIGGDEEAVEERFWCGLSFGTGGLRARMGAGSNRINLYTIGQAAQGVAAYLRQEHSGNLLVCIGYDTRIHSREFALHAACVLCANGIKVFLFKDPRPTPMLSFMVREKRAAAGIVITASHNASEYNGFKVYDAGGVQVTDDAAGRIQRQISAVDPFSQVDTMELYQAEEEGRLVWITPGDEDGYFSRVAELSCKRDLVRAHGGDVRVLYTPLHGTGAVPIQQVFSLAGFPNLGLVPEQMQGDGRFPTAPYPNPEDESVYTLALERAASLRPDIILATDPDCDRVGVMARHGEAYIRLSGNQIGALLCSYLLSARREAGTLPENAGCVKTIVTSDLAQKVCESYGVSLAETLTGFKYIGEQAERWRAAGTHTFLFGFEESCGYLTGDFVRDKDAVIAALLITEMTLYHKTQERTLLDALEELYSAHGYYQETLLTIEMPGRAGKQNIAQAMAHLRREGRALLPEARLTAVEDYAVSLVTDVASGEQKRLALPVSDVLKLRFEHGWIVLRPSGTEPKLKMYVSFCGKDRKTAEQRSTYAVRQLKAFLSQIGERI